MARLHSVVDASLGPWALPSVVPFTAAEEAAADAEAKAPPAPTVEDRVAAIEAVLVQKTTITTADLVAETAIQASTP